MVLQRGSPATFWGWASPGTPITALLSNADTNASLRHETRVADASGQWSVTFPAQNASGFSWRFFVATNDNDFLRCSAYQYYCSGASLSLSGLAFGDVVECLGQSNMQVTVGFAFNATEELAFAENFGPLLRYFQVEASVTSKGAPLDDFAVAPSIPWSAPPASLAYFSAACYFTAKAVLLARPEESREVPLGLVAAPWGGTTIKAHAPPAVNGTCGALYPGGTFGCGMDHAPCNASEIYNALLYPISGPSAAFPVSAFVWFQGENDNSNDTQALAWYSCNLAGLAAALRADHASPLAHWTTVQLAPYDGGTPLPYFRRNQCAATEASIAASHCAILQDDGDVLSPIGSVHSRNKQLAGQRIALGLLEGLYSKAHPTHGRGPVFLNHTFAPAPGAPGTLTATVSFAAAGLGGRGLTYRPPAATPWSNSTRCPSELGPIKQGDCGWPGIVGSDGVLYNASASIAGNGVDLLLTATGVPQGVEARGTAYGWGAWPVLNFYNEFEMPVEAWHVAA
jgi:hypothetical protein